MIWNFRSMYSSPNRACSDAIRMSHQRAMSMPPPIAGPFTAAMIPIILGMETQGINVTPLWWGLAMGVGLGGNGTHIGSTANVFIVTISERLARQENDPSLAITPGMWFRKGTPAMLATLVVATLMMYFGWSWFENPVT